MHRPDGKSRTTWEGRLVCEMSGNGSSPYYGGEGQGGWLVRWYRGCRNGRRSDSKVGMGCNVVEISIYGWWQWW